MIFTVRSYDVLLHHCSRFGEGWDTTNLCNIATLRSNVPVPSQEPVIQWLLFGAVLHICVSKKKCTLIWTFVFSFEL